MQQAWCRGKGGVECRLLPLQCCRAGNAEVMAGCAKGWGLKQISLTQRLPSNSVPPGAPGQKYVPSVDGVSAGEEDQAGLAKPKRSLIRPSETTLPELLH